MCAAERIPFEVEAGRVIDLLARQIYQTPLALLRENCQNAFDAILLRRAIDPHFEPRIDVSITSRSISVQDNGVGMSAEELKANFWRAGASGKNNEAARAAGVVGTFGIGAMANFGIASEVEVITESVATRERTRSFARKSELSTSKECISLDSLPSEKRPGTRVTATCASPLEVNGAVDYLRSFVGYIRFPVAVNGVLVSGQAYETGLPAPDGATFRRENVTLAPGFVATIEGVITSQADVWVRLAKFYLGGESIQGIVLLRQGRNSLMSFRSGFGLAPASVASFFNFGGLADLPLLVPTAGREALSTESLQLLQHMVTATDRIVAEELAERPEAHWSTGLMSWALQHNRIELCGNLRAVREPGGTLIELFRLRRDKGAGKIRFYTGEDKTILNAHATTETPVVVIATRTPRRTVEQQYLRQFCEIEEISGQPQALSVRDASRRSTAENALTYRIKSLLESDYFVDADVTIGKVSHGLPLLVDIFGGRNRVVLSESAGCNTAFIELYSSDFAAFGSMIKDYVRSVLFPKIQHLVPSAHRQGAAAFLKAIARPREVFEYEVADLQSLNEIWARYAEGSISFDQAATRSSEIARASVQFIESGSARPAREVIADVMDNEAVVATIVTTEDRAGEPLPAIDRAQTATEAKILLIADDEQSIRGFRCFVALADRVRDERGEFFLEPHRTSVVWGGQRVLFVFQHVSGEYGLYYDLQAPALVAETSGGGTYETCTVLMKNRIFIPVPPQVQAAFVPQHGERKRFEVKCDILYLGDT